MGEKEASLRIIPCYSWFIPGLRVNVKEALSLGLYPRVRRKERTLRRLLSSCVWRKGRNNGEKEASFIVKTPLKPGRRWDSSLSSGVKSGNGNRCSGHAEREARDGGRRPLCASPLT